MKFGIHTYVFICFAFWPYGIYLFSSHTKFKAHILSSCPPILHIFVSLFSSHNAPDQHRPKQTNDTAPSAKVMQDTKEKDEVREAEKLGDEEHEKQKERERTKGKKV